MGSLEEAVQITCEDQFTSILIPLIEEFIVRSGDFERKAGSVIKQVNSILEGGNGGLWIAWDGIEPIGYAFADVVNSEYSTLVCLVHQLFVLPGYREHQVPLFMDVEIGRWAKRKGASEMACFTRRKPHALMNVLLSAWGIDSVVLKRKLF